LRVADAQRIFGYLIIDLNIKKWWGRSNSCIRILGCYFWKAVSQWSRMSIANYTSAVAMNGCLSKSK